MGIKYAVNERFFHTWSNNMAYVLGYLFADGSLEDASYLRGKYVRVTSTDVDRVEVIKKLLSSSHTVVKTKPPGNRKMRYMLRIGSHVLYDRLNFLGVTPRKSLTMQFPTIPDDNLPSFVRGYFDGDGCVYIGCSPTGAPRLVTIFTSGSRMFLDSLDTKLRATIGITGGALHEHGSTAGTFQLRLFGRDSIRLFGFMYDTSAKNKLSMKRKYDIFNRYFKEARSEPRRLIKYIPRARW